MLRILESISIHRKRRRCAARLHRRLVVVLLCVGIGTSASGPDAAAADDGEFHTVVAPFLAKHCVRCHGSSGPKGEVRLDALSGRLSSDGDETKTWEAVFGQLDRREMPPEGEPAVDDDERDAVLQWLRDELRRVGRGDATAGNDYPERGNYLDHQLLFGKPSDAAGATPSRLWRISPFQYDELVSRFFVNPPRYGHGLPNPLGLTNDPGFRDYAFRYVVGPAETRQLYLNAEAIVARIVAEEKLGKRFAPDLHAAAYAAETPSEADVGRAVTWLFEQLLLRPPSDDELRRYTTLTFDNIAQSGVKQGVVRGLAPIFIHPEVLYRSELGEGPVDEHGRRPLSPRETAFAVAYALTDRMPDEPLRLAAAEGRLSDREVVREQVERILNDPQIEKPRMLRFFQEYFGYDQAPGVFKDVRLHSGAFGGVKHVRPPELVRDTDQLVLHILGEDRRVLRELLTTNRSFVQSVFIKEYRTLQAKMGEQELNKQSRYRWLGLYYSLPPEQWSPDQPLELPADQRAGILTQPSWLYSYSTNVENHPIHRGEWVYKRLLGGTIPDVPITVDAQLPVEPHNTLRERMRFTLDGYCWRCHQRMNPIGLAFEMFDQYGQFRTHETVLPVESKENVRPKPLALPVNATGGIEKSPEPSLDGPAENALELIRRLADSEHVEQVFVRHAFRYWMGRNETLDDAATLQAAHRAYRESDGSMKALVASLLTSDSFLYRRPQ